MILFWILFLLIVIISAILAYLSMKDFRQSPEDFGSENGLFLIRKPSALTPKIFESLYEIIKPKDQILSLERLFKGRESALAIYGPKIMFEGLTRILDLLELEDYSGAKVEVSAWEMGIKDSSRLQFESLFLKFPKLDSGDEVWCQIVLKARKGENSQFSAQIREVVVSQDAHRRKKLSDALESRRGRLIKIPQPLSTTQMMGIYRKRSIGGRNTFKLTGEEIVKLWSLPQI